MPQRTPSEGLERLAELFHPEARIAVFAGGGLPRDPDDAIAAMATAHETLVYQADIDSVRVPCGCVERVCAVPG